MFLVGAEFRIMVVVMSSSRSPSCVYSSSRACRMWSSSGVTVFVFVWVLKYLMGCFPKSMLMFAYLPPLWLSMSEVVEEFEGVVVSRGSEFCVAFTSFYAVRVSELLIAFAT